MKSNTLRSHALEREKTYLGFLSTEYRHGVRPPEASWEI